MRLETRKPFVGTLRVANPARQSLAGSRKRVLRGEGRPSLRSVDSQCQGRVIEPRKLLVGALVLVRRGGHADPSQSPDVVGPAGVGEQGQGTSGVSGNLGDPSVSTAYSGSVTGTTTPRSPRPGVAGRWEQRIDATVVSPSEGNEARREGRAGVGASHSTVEAGEPSRGTQRREGDAVSSDRWRETWRVLRNPWTCPRNDDGSHNSRDEARRWDSRLWRISLTSTG